MEQTSPTFQHVSEILCKWDQILEFGLQADILINFVWHWTGVERVRFILNLWGPIFPPKYWIVPALFSAWAKFYQQKHYKFVCFLAVDLKMLLAASPLEACWSDIGSLCIWVCMVNLHKTVIINITMSLLSQQYYLNWKN